MKKKFSRLKSINITSIILSVFLGISFVSLLYVIMRLEHYRTEYIRFQRVKKSEEMFSSILEKNKYSSNELEFFLKKNKIVDYIGFDDELNVKISYKNSELTLHDKETFVRKENNNLAVFAPFFSSSENNLNYFYILCDDDGYFNKCFRIKTTTNIMVLCLILTFFLIIFLYRKIIKVEIANRHNEDLIMLGNASASIVHELKNPLLSISLQTKYLEKIHPESADELKIINTEVDRMSGIVNKIKLFLNKDEGKIENIDFIPFVDECCQRFTDIDIKKDFCNREIIVFFDKIRLKSIIDNCIVNAIEAVETKEQAEISIEIKLINNKKCCVVIKDNGCGINIKDKNNFFIPYWTTKAQGTGIGLSIVQWFITQQGGQVSLVNRTDGQKGAQCTLTFNCIVQPI